MWGSEPPSSPPTRRREREHDWQQQQHLGWGYGLQQQPRQPWLLREEMFQGPQARGYGLPQPQEEMFQAEQARGYGIPQRLAAQEEMFQAEQAWGYGLPQRRQYEEPREREHQQQLQGVPLHRAWGYGLQRPQHPQRLVSAREYHPQTGFTQQSVAQETSRPPRQKRGFEHKERRDSRPCRYYNKPGGCRKGSQCSFYHGLGSKTKERAQEREAEAVVSGIEEDAFAVKPSLPVKIEKDVSAQTLDATSSILPGQIAKSISPVHQSGKVTLIAHDIKEQNLFEMAWTSISEDDKKALAEFAKGNLNLQMFDSKVPPHRQIPMVKGKPSLLMYRLDESLGQESQEILEHAHNAGNVLLLGTSGCGKTRCLFELLAKSFGLYLVAGTMGNGGSHDVEAFLINRGLDELEKCNIEDPMKRESFIKDLTSILLWARLEILNFCLEQNPQFSPYQWLLCQLGYATVGVDIFSKLCQNIYSLWVRCQNLSVLQFQFIHTAETVVERAVNSTCESKIFLTVLDEAQVLLHHGKNMFPSLQYPGNVTRTMFSPVFKALQRYHSRTGCVLTSGTGMGLVTQIEALLSGIAKANQEPLTFTKFRGWQNSEHVRNYLHTFMDVSIEDCASLFETFRGRYRPMVSCIEEVLSGKTIDEAKQSVRLGLTRSKQLGSFYNALARLADGTRTGKVNVIATLTSVLFHFLYSGGLPYPVRDKDEMQMIEYGIGRIVPLDEYSPVPQKPSSLLLRGFSNAEMVYVCIDEPLAIEALKNFCIDQGLLEQKWHDALRFIPSKSSRGFTWERYVKSDFEKMFGASVPLCSHPLFQELKIKHSRFRQQPVKIVTPNEKAGFVAEVTYSTDQYSLDDYLSSDPEKSSPFFVCDQNAGPDVCFRVRFADGSILPAFGQFKLRVDVTRQDLVVETTNPHNFYTYINKEGERMVRNNRRKDRNNILKACKDGLLRFVIMYPATIKGITSLEIEADGEIGPQLLGVVGAQNAHNFLDSEHILFLKNLCYD